MSIKDGAQDTTEFRPCHSVQRVDLVSFFSERRPLGFRPFFLFFFSSVKHGWTQHQTLAPAHHIAKSFPTQLTQLTISCISVRRLSLHVFNFSEWEREKSGFPLIPQRSHGQWNEGKRGKTIKQKILSMKTKEKGDDSSQSHRRSCHEIPFWFYYSSCFCIFLFFFPFMFLFRLGPKCVAANCQCV